MHVQKQFVFFVSFKRDDILFLQQKEVKHMYQLVVTRTCFLDALPWPNLALYLHHGTIDIPKAEEGTPYRSN
jgi:hypothetical protein